MLPLRFCILLLLALCANGKNSSEDGTMNLQFPPDFVLGAATAAYQIEGAWNVSDKGESIWDYYTHFHSERIDNGDTGDEAALSYYKYKEDVAILKKLGFTSYRFSVSWPRILPTGFSNKISEDGVKYYHNLIDELLANNIEPMLTLYHWDHPQVIEDFGGWTNSEIVDWFGDYARVVFSEYGSKVKKFIPINEPNVLCEVGYATGKHAPGKLLHGFGEYMCVHNILKAHARSYRIYEEEFKPKYKGEVGVLLNIFGHFPKTPSDVDLVEVAFQFDVGWLLHPIYSKEGDYPAIMKTTVEKKSLEQGYRKSRMPSFSADWIKYIKGTSDFLAVNHYTSSIVSKGSTGYVPSRENDVGLIKSADSTWKRGKSSWLYIVPEGFRVILQQLKENYGNPPIYITENGISDCGSLNDDGRIQYYREYLEQMLLAMYKDGVNVKGFLLWSLLDNFEWEQGYSEHFGIINVDFKSPGKERKWKKSASWWKNVVATRRIDID